VVGDGGHVLVLRSFLVRSLQAAGSVPAIFRERIIESSSSKPNSPIFIAIVEILAGFEGHPDVKTSAASFRQRLPRDASPPRLRPHEPFDAPTMPK
jgi:hypothetical protein